MTLTPEILGGFAGAVMSLAFSYVPGLSDWFGKLNSKQKSGLTALVIIAVAGAAYGLSCAGWIAAVPCTQDGLVRLAQTVFAALVVNQSVYQLSPQKSIKPTPTPPVAIGH